MDQLKIVTSLDGGYSQWWSALPQEDSGFRSLWVTADGYFYCLARKQMKVCSKVFTTPMYTIEACQSFHLSSQVVVTCARILTHPQAEVLKGDLCESDGGFRFSRKMEVRCGWAGESSYDWNFTLDGYVFVPWLDSHRVVCLQVIMGHCVSNRVSPKDRAIMFKKTPIVVKFVREADSKGRPFELHTGRCAKWGSGVDQAMRSSKSQLNSAGASSGDASASDQAPWN